MKNPIHLTKEEIELIEIALTDYQFTAGQNASKQFVANNDGLGNAYLKRMGQALELYKKLSLHRRLRF